LLSRTTSAMGISTVAVALGWGSGASVAVLVGVWVTTTSVCVAVNLVVAGAFVADCPVGDETSTVPLLSGKLQAERINAPRVNK